VHVHAANVLASVLVCAERCVAQAEEAAPDMLGCRARKFRNLAQVSLFAQAYRSQEDTRESTTHLLKLDACDRAILLTSVGVFAKFELCVYIYLSM